MFSSPHTPLNGQAPSIAPRRAIGAAVLLVSVLAFGLTVSPSAQAETDADVDRSLSPYFVVKGAGDVAVEAMPLVESRADVSVTGTIAHVKVTQVYQNEGQTPIEALYVFPGSTRAAVFGLRMTIGDRVVVARIQKRAEARATYEQAKSQGKTATLLEQHRPNVFQMNVANILPGDIVKVELEYTELLVPEAGQYEVVVPAVVGPRYVGEGTAGAEPQPWTRTAHTRAGEPASYAWGVHVRLAAGVPVQKVISPSHGIRVSGLGQPVATIALTDPSPGGDRDFVLQFRLAGDAISSGLVLYPGEDESFFLMMLQPPAKVPAALRPRREYVFILDVSGSMHGFPLDTARSLMRRLLADMNEGDLFNIMFFSGGAEMLAEQSLPATPANRNRALGMLESMRGSGGTELVPALRRALAFETAPDVSRTFVVVTDGYVSVERDAFELIRDNLGKANLFAFGIGSSVNRHLVEGLARAGQGEPFVVLNGDDAPAAAKRFQNLVESPALTRVRVGFEGFEAYDVEPATIPDLFAERPVVVFGKYRGEPKGRITLAGLNGAGPFSATLDVEASAPSAANEALRYLWARHRIAALADMNRLDVRDARTEEVTRLGLAYNLLTEYTSFVAVDERVRNGGGQSTTVQQPLPLPAGVDDAAVSTGMGGLGLQGAGVGGGGGYSGAVDGFGGGAFRGRGGPRRKSEADSGAARALRASVQATSWTVSGALETDVVKRVVLRNQAVLRACFESQVLKIDPSAKGKLTAKLVISAEGEVTAVSFTQVPKALEPMIACLGARLERLRFPKPGKGVVIVQFGLAFTTT